MRIVLIGGAVLMAAAAILFFMLRSASGPDGPAFKTAKVKRGDLKLTVTATGTLQARNTVDVGAEVTGRLIAVKKDFNDPVEQGQILARIDPVPFELEVSQAKARLLSATAALASARAAEADATAKWERGRALVQDGLMSRQELDGLRAAALRARADIASARAKIAEAEAALQASSTRLEKTTIRSPIAGIVLDRKVEAGQTVTAGFQTPVLFSLATDLAEMELKAAVDEADIGKLTETSDATFTVDAYPGRIFKSRVMSIRNVPRTSQNVVTYEAVLSVNNDDRALRPGMTATANIVATEVKDAVLVPVAALRFKPSSPGTARDSRGPGIPFLMGPPRPPGERKTEKQADKDPGRGVVWTLDNGVPVPHRVRKGVSDGEHVQILESDLEPGMEVITDSVVSEVGK